MVSLTDAERHRFFLYAMQQAKIAHGMAEQMEKINTFGPVVKMVQSGSAAWFIVAKKLAPAEDMTIRGDGA